MKKLIFLIAILLSTHTTAETSKERTIMYFNDLQSGNYLNAASHFDPQQLKEFRTMMEFYKEMPAEMQNKFLATFYGPGSTVESISKFDDSQFFAAMFGFIMRQAESIGGINFDATEILGAVQEGNNIEHLVTRSKVSAGELDMEAMEVVSLVKRGGRWYIMMSGKIKGLPQQIKAAFSQAR